MKKCKCIVAFLMVIIIAVTAVGCFPSEPRTDISGGSDDPSETVDTSGDSDAPSETVIDEYEAPDFGDIVPLYGEPEKLTRDMIPERYEDTVMDNLTIAADVRIPESLDFKALGAKWVDIPRGDDQNRIVELFIDGETEQEHDEDEYGFVDSYTAPNGEEVIFNDSAIWYERVDYNDPDYLQYSWYYETHMRYNPRLKDYFTKSELEGIDREATVSMVNEKVKVIGEVIGAEFVETPEVYCLDAEGAKAYCEDKALIYGSSELDDSFKEENNAYLLIYRFAFDGLPIYMNLAQKSPELWYEGGYIIAVVDRDGIVNFELSQGVAATGETLEIDGMYNVDVVKTALEDYFGKFTIANPKIITDIHLEYMCRNPLGPNKRKTGLIFEPYWICYFTSRADSWATDNPQGCVYVNALTGELLNENGLGSVRMW